MTGKTTKSEIVCLVIISLGVMLAVWEESKNALLGITLTVVSTVMQSFQMSISGRVMAGAKSAAGGGLDSFQMTFYTGPIAFVTLLPFAVVAEFNTFTESLLSRPAATIGFLLGSCCVAVIYNIVLFQARAQP